MKSVFVFKIHDHNPSDIFSALSAQPYSLFFDSTDQKHELSRYSYVAYSPFETIEAQGRKVTIINPDQHLSFTGDPFHVLKDRIEIWGQNIEGYRTDIPPFQGGAAGYFGYDMGRTIENLADTKSEPSQAPDMAVGLYDTVYSFDHKKSRGSLIVIAESEDAARSKLSVFLKTINGGSGNDNTPPVVKNSYIEEHEWHSPFTKEGYENSIQRVIDYIYAGDIFQANLSQCFSAKLPQSFNAFAHYKTLRKVNAAPFGAFMTFGDTKLASASPEQFLSVHGNLVETRPIKGTRPRLQHKIYDEEMKSDLLASEKDRAENIMIVDLLRNDLSKVCEDFSVKVTKLCELESFAKVHHLVSGVRGILRANKNPVDLLRACFPGGSITGAPKIRAMEVIDELEPTKRGPYCGAMGFIGFNGSMETNIMIRTLIYEGDTVRFNVGGGIVSDSVPADEYQETLDKAAAIFDSFSAPKKEEQAA